MNIASQLIEAINLMIVGMTFVSVFLGVLVFIIPLLDKISPDDSLSDNTVNNSYKSSIDICPKTVAVIAVAVKQYRNKH